jgi:hypothetical protein
MFRRTEFDVSLAATSPDAAQGQWITYFNFPPLTSRTSIS